MLPRFACPRALHINEGHDSVVASFVDAHRTTYQRHRYTASPGIPVSTRALTRLEDLLAPEPAHRFSLFDAAQLLSERRESRAYLIEPRVVGAGDTVVVVGPPKSGKSWVVLDMLASFSSGRPWHALEPGQPLTSLWLNFELSLDVIHERLETLGHCIPRGSLRVTDRLRQTVQEGGFQEHLLEELGGFAPDLLVIDPLANTFTGRSENDNAEMTSFMRELWAFRDSVNPQAALILVHHTSKQNGSKIGFDQIRGASALRGAYDAGILINRTKHGLLTLSFELRNGPEVREITLKLKDGRLEGCGPRTSAERAESTIRKLLIDAAASTPPQLSTANDFAATFARRDGLNGKASLKKALRQLAAAGKVRFAEHVDELGAPRTRAHGWLVVQGLKIGGRDVLPTHRIVDGRLQPCNGWEK